jgi:hypothetical protein
MVMVIKSGTGVKDEQGKEEPRSDAVRYTRWILPEIWQQRALPAKDHWRCAAQRYHPLRRSQPSQE